jgi:hypothetical protein
MTITDLMRRMQDCGFSTANVEFSIDLEHPPVFVEARCTVGNNGHTGTARRRFRVESEDPNPDSIVDFGLGACFASAIRDFMAQEVTL